MSIVTFWNADREQSGVSISTVAVATKMAIERNLKVLIVSAAYNDSTIKNCFWGNEVSRNLKLFGGKLNNIAVENGIEGLSKLIAANKLTPDVITDYTKVIFKGRLEVLNGFNGMKDADEMTNIKTYEKIAEGYVDLIRTANQYYDMVLVDLDKTIFAGIREKILEISNVNVMVFSQKKESLDRYIKYKENASSGELNKLVPVIGKYMDQSKYNLKNIMKYIGERKEINVVPFNMLYFEAAEEAMVTDLLLRLKNVKDTSDENYIFMQDVLNLTDKIIKRLQELQMKMR